jgi:hypothetical protein
MAALIKKPNTSYWFLRYRDLDTGAWRSKSTGCRHDSDIETRKAQRMCDEATTKENRITENRPKGQRDNPAFNVWVPGFMESHFKTRAAGTARRFHHAWQRVRIFLGEFNIVYPTQIRYRHADMYMKWRTAEADEQAGHNTALLELKFLSQLMNEAMRREFILGNPIARLGIKKAYQPEKPELTNAEIMALRKAFHKGRHSPWMATAFEISLYTGCRFQEAQIPMENIDFDRNRIMLRDSKRADDDPRKYWTVPIHPDLKPTLLALRDAGAKETCDLRPRDRNRRINQVFHKHANATFHSLRVTFITRCQRAGLSQADTMRLVNHSTALVHRIYSRMNCDDAQNALAKVLLPKFHRAKP